MRIRTTWQIREGELPIHYRMGLVALVKEALKMSDAHYVRRIYNGSNRSKPFGFASFLHEPVFHDTHIVLKKFSITFSSGDHEFLLHLMNGMRNIVEFQYKNSSWYKEKIQLIKERPISSSIVTMKTQSPLLIENMHGQPLSPHDSDYQEQLNYYAELVTQNMVGRPLFRPIEIKNFRMHKTVIKEGNQSWDHSNTRKNHIYFTAYRGYLQLQGHPHDLTVIYQYGIGRRRSQGFGLLDIVRED